MRLIFIRHGDPDYINDNLTEKGKREAELLAKRVCKWKNITEIYQSPLGRAKATAKPALNLLNRSAITCDWLREFDYRTEYPKHFFIKEFAGKQTMCWDYLPEIFYKYKKHFCKDKWFKSPLFKKEIKTKYLEVCNNMDSLLQKYGYIRNKKGFYDVQNPVHNPNFDPKYDILNFERKENGLENKYQLVSIKNQKEECTLVFFCHLGVMFAIISHLTGLSPLQMWQNFYVAPTSVTILNTEERIKGQAMFRLERLSDTNHLTNNNEKISTSGYFTDVLNEVE